MNVNREQEANEHKRLHQKISKLKHPDEDTREITGKVTKMENVGREFIAW